MLNLSFVYCEVQSIETPVTIHHHTVSGGDLPGLKPKEPDGDSTFLSSSLFKQEIPQCFHVMSKNRVACTLVSGIGNYSLYNISWVWMRQTPSSHWPWGMFGLDWCRAHYSASHRSLCKCWISVLDHWVDSALNCGSMVTKHTTSGQKWK